MSKRHQVPPATPCEFEVEKLGENEYLHTCKVCGRPERAGTPIMMRGCVASGPNPPGLGDVAAYAFEYLGFTKEKVSGWIGVECNCPERQARLNRLGRYVGRRLKKLGVAVPWDTKMQWAYGVTTVPQRLEDLLPRTLASLAAAGFDKPHIFVDGHNGQGFKGLEGYTATIRNPGVKTAGNWMLSALELTIRDPHADRYAIFQDDIVCCRGLREYLEACPYPERGYLNLYTYSLNERENKAKGWYAAPRAGKGALALVFDRAAIVALLTSDYMMRRHQSLTGWQAIDGGIFDAMNVHTSPTYPEYVHYPSLIQHTGSLSTMGNTNCIYSSAPSFVGEQYNALDLLK